MLYSVDRRGQTLLLASFATRKLYIDGSLVDQDKLVGVQVRPQQILQA